MDQLPRVKPGQLLGLKDNQGRIVINASTAKFLNRIVAEMKRLGKVSAAAPLRWEEGADGRRFACDLPPFIWAKLSGSGNPYSFVQQKYDPGTNTWSDMAGGRSGSNAYESKGKSGLAGKVVGLNYVATANDWRFQYVGIGFNCAWKFVVTGCNSMPLVGALIELRQGGTLIDSCTTDGYVASVTRTNGGSGGTNGTYTDGTFTGAGGSGGTFSYTISGGVVQPTITVTNPGSGYQFAPTPVFGSAAGVGASATAAITAYCRMTPPQGTYDVTVSATGLTSSTQSLTFTCVSTGDIQSTIGLNTPDSNHVCVSCCAYPLPKTLTTTDALGTTTLTYSSGSWDGTATVSGDVWTAASGSGACVAGTSMTVTYSLTTSCTFQVGWKVLCCNVGTLPPVPYVRYADDAAPGTTVFGAGTGLSTGTLISCNPFSMTFGIPATGQVGTTDPCGTPTSHVPGLDTPGGSRTQSVTA